MPVTPEEVLAHYGVPGMKWGRRKADDSSGSSSKKSKADMTPEERDAHDQKVKRNVAIGATAAITALQVGSYFVSRHMTNKLIADLDAEAASAGVDKTLKAVGNLSTFVLHPGADGVFRK